VSDVDRNAGQVAVDAEDVEREDEGTSWYADLVVRAELADYSPVRGCMVVRPYGYAVWEFIRDHLDREFKATGHQNAYFPIFIPYSFLEREKQHVEGFSPELAVVTHGGGEELAEKLVVRPTSETMIWAMYGKWIQSYRDLPMLLNQWGNVVRWEKRTRPFLRTMEFLWQEGHTAHVDQADADRESRQMLDIYARCARELLAIPVVMGRKTEREKFAGAVVTYTIESLMRDGKALQMGTSHYLGDNFARAFDVTFLDRDGQRKHPHSSSWGVSWRLIGGVILSHGDKKGLIFPPRIAPDQVVIVPIYRTDAEQSQVRAAVEEILKDLIGAGVRARADWRDQLTPGFKFNDLEMRGVPLRLEVGPRDVARGQVVAARRDTGTKDSIARADLATSVPAILVDIQRSLYDRAVAFLDENTRDATSLEELATIIDDTGGFVRLNWCESASCEASIAAHRTSIRCIPLDDEDARPTGNCAICGQPAVARVYVAKAY
jgi:prolyl-tRNA synthetase